jgi:hypothetical protein
VQGIPGADRIADGYATIRLPSWIALAAHYRRLEDGRLVVWSNTIASLVDPMTISDDLSVGNPIEYLHGVRALANGAFVAWGADISNAALAMELDGTSTIAPGGAINDITVADSTMFMSVQGGAGPKGVYQWNLGTAPINLSGTTIDPLTASGTSDGMLVAAIDRSANHLYTYTPTSGVFAQVLNAPASVGVYVRTTTDIYILADAGVYRRNNANTWSLIPGSKVDVPSEIVAFTDKQTLAIVGDSQVKLICDANTTGANVCDTIETGATHVSGTGPKDVWLTQATARVTPQTGLVHYDGVDRAPVNVPTRGTSKVIAATTDVIVEGSDANLYKLVRFAPL